jgi:teichuronic acid biosynthesis protein TuaE
VERLLRGVPTAAIVGFAALLVATFAAYAARGHVAVPVLVPCLLGVGLLGLALRRRLARLSVRRLLVAGLVVLPALAVLGPALALPHFGSLYGFRVVLALTLAGGLLWLITERPHLHIEAGTYLVLYLAWVAWLLITLAWTSDVSVATHYLALFISLGAVAAVTASAGLSDRRLRAMLTGLACALGLALLVATGEWLTRLHLPSASPDYLHRRIATAFFYNANDFATYLALCWPFLLIAPLMCRRRRVVVVSLVALLLSAFALLHTGSRLSLIAIALETLIVALAAAVRGGRAVRLAVTVILIVGLVAIALVLTGHGTSLGIRNKFSLLHSSAASTTHQSSSSTRLQLQLAGLRAAETRWFLGVGPGNAEVLVARENPQFTIFNLHDWWMEVLVDGGLPALLIFATMYLMLVVSMRRVMRFARDPLLRYLGTATLVALLGFAIAIVDPSTAIKFPPMAILLGLAVAVLIGARREERRDHRTLTTAAPDQDDAA